jgi:aminoglycoside phosphotransferase (APT) family kinase protein
MHESLVALVSRALGLPSMAVEVAIRPPLDHQTNRLYDVWAGGRRLILKEYLQVDDLREAPLREFRALELLRLLDIAPRPFFVETAPTTSLGPIVAYEFMDGVMWGRRRPSDSSLAALAEVWLAMHALPTGGLWMAHGNERSLAEAEASFRSSAEAYTGWAESEFPEGRRTAEFWLAALERCHEAMRELADYDPLLSFCRSDQRFSNVIQRPDGRIGLVDWEDSGLRDPARELVDLLTHPNQEGLLSMDEWQPFIHPYLAARGILDRQLIRRTHFYMAVFPVSWLAILADRGRKLAEAGRLATWIINGLPPELCLQRYLARALAWPQVDFSRQLDALRDVRFFPHRDHAPGGEA